MNDILEKLMKLMPSSPTELTDKNKAKIREYMPVPNDFDILWADIQSFAGYPEGTVITDRGIGFHDARGMIQKTQFLKR